MQYENHMLENELLPFIFHYDIISGKFDSLNEFSNWHENPEFLYFTKGAGKIRYNDRVFHVEKGDLAVINSDCFHAVSSDGNLEYYCLIVDLGFFLSNGITIDKFSFEPIIRNVDYKKEFEDLDKLYRLRPEFHCAKIRSGVLSLIIDLSQRYRIEKIEQAHFQDQVKDVVNYIKSHFKEQITIGDIVRRAGFSRAYLSRQFKKGTGVTIIEYLNYVRCRHAKMLLGSGDITVGAAAQECGYTNLSYFTRTYRRLMGTLPSEEVGAAKENVKNISGEVNMKIIKDDLEFYV